MLGFVGLLSSALAAVVNVFVVMLLSFLQAQMAPKEGEYKLATESGLVFPLETHVLDDEVFATMAGSFNRIYGEVPMYIGVSCVRGDDMDGPTAKRYATYNYVFSQYQAKTKGGKYDIANVDHLENYENVSKLSNVCFVAMKTEKLYKQTIEANEKN